MKYTETKNSRKNSTQKLVIIALFASIICVATMIIKIPSPMKGYVNLGDCVILLCGWLLSPASAFIASGLGSALADLFSGYVIYAPATFVIKGLMAIIFSYGIKLFSSKIGNTITPIISGIASEIWMIVGYYVFEGFLYGFAASLVNIPANGFQGLAGVILGNVLIILFKKGKINFK